MRAIRWVGALAMLTGLCACGESAETAYERGVEDGAAEVCNELYRDFYKVYSELESRQYC